MLIDCPISGIKMLSSPFIVFLLHNLNMGGEWPLVSRLSALRCLLSFVVFVDNSNISLFHISALPFGKASNWCKVLCCSTKNHSDFNSLKKAPDTTINHVLFFRRRVQVTSFDRHGQPHDRQKASCCPAAVFRTYGRALETIECNSQALAWFS